MLFSVILFRVAFILCGSNIDISTLIKVLDNGLLYKGKIKRVVLEIIDSSNSLIELLVILSENHVK